MSKVSDAISIAIGSSDDNLFDACGFTHDYHQYADPLTEAPWRYHSFAALAVVAAVVGRKIYLVQGARDVYPNIWVALVGKSSQLKKSTVLRIASDLIDDHNRKLLFPEDFSREALYDALAEQGSGIFIWNELGGVLRAFENNYMAGTKELLTELYDCPAAKVRKLKTKEIIIKDACPTVLCASTVDWLNGNMKQVDLRSGFAARFVYVPAEEPSAILSNPPSRNLVLRDSLLSQMARLSQLSGKMHLTPEAAKEYDDWYRKMHYAIRALPISSRVHSFASRLQNYGLKFAMLFQVARDGAMEIDEDAVWRGCQVCNWLFSEAQKLVDEELSCNDRERDIKEVAGFIQQAKVVTRQSLITAFRKHKSRDLDEIEQNLIESGLIKLSSSGRAKLYTWTGSAVA